MSAEDELERILDDGPVEVAKLIDAYLPFEAAYVAATTSAAQPVVATTTTGFPRSDSFEWATTAF